MPRAIRVFALSVALSFVATFCQAQFQDGSQPVLLNIPLISQKAAVSQTLGITDITINYHRPLAGERKIWGSTVPYDQVWRAGANQNTTIEFTDPVTVEGQKLDKGVYGLHMIPGKEEWTIIFSRDHTAWGSFAYDQTHDALRVKVRPHDTDFHNALMYEFEELKPDSAAITLKWEKLAIPFRVAVDVNGITQASLPSQLQGYAQFTWDGWDDAAKYLLENKLDLEQALKYSERSIQNEERFDNLLTRSRVLKAQGHAEEAETTLAKALDKASAAQAHVYGRQLILEKRNEEAFKVFRANAAKHPEAWIVHAGLARMYSAEGKFDDAVKELKVAQQGAPGPQKPQIDGLIRRLEANEDINK
jgi:tetratricopeptide (TPR) repeat protein